MMRGSPGPQPSLLICGRTEVTLSAVLQQHNSRIRFPADLLDIVFIEKWPTSPDAGPSPTGA